MLMILTGAGFGVFTMLPATPIYEAAAEGDIPGIVFVAAPMFDERSDGVAGVYQGSCRWRDSYVYARATTFTGVNAPWGRPGPAGTYTPWFRRDPTGN